MVDERDDRPEEQHDTVDQLRATLASGFAFVRSREVTTSVASVTFEEAVEAAVAAINVDESDIRVSKLTRVQNLKAAVAAVVEQARAMPASAFVAPPGQGAANTTVEGEGPSGEES